MLATFAASSLECTSSGGEAGLSAELQVLLEVDGDSQNSGKKKRKSSGSGLLQLGNNFLDGKSGDKRTKTGDEFHVPSAHCATYTCCCIAHL